ncbi:hypothetical protein DWB77_03334 [Streptomyces hundungensis]|uniref:Lipoprotein n=1 Tax=Streptomyces hundungensis TaxID=1077946 RepID=A0A387HK33_9ACTN|nr:hypothetical protein [Streptomyces hundungensis]AYG81192.1 hypothetical protein DWB77_03334 [Streptomyces hundungensis]
MNRRALPAVAALTATVALLLTACGSNDKPKDSDKIAGADQSAKPSASASPSASAPAGVERPKIELPADLTMTFEPANTGDPVKEAVLSDGAERMRAVNVAITGGDPKYAALNYYNSGKALEAASAWVEKFKKAGLSMTGSLRYYDRQVTLNQDKSASLNFCADESKGYSKDIKTGKAKVTTPSKNDFILYSTRLEKNSAGVWQTTRIVSTAGAEKCVK